VATKAEKRIAKTNLRLAHTLAKSARQFEIPDPQKVVAEAAETSPQKTVPADVLPPSHQLMRWCRDMEDAEGRWSWNEARAAGPAWDIVVQPALQQFAQRYWHEIDSDRVGHGRHRRPKHCFYDFESIVEEAKLRLEELEIDDFSEQIFRFRIAGRKRIYGFRVSPMFYFVWYDPEHHIYPLD
jgi:hypothetical protein